MEQAEKQRSASPNGYPGEIAFQQIIQSKDPVFVPVPGFISPSVLTILSNNQIRFLYAHQAEALETTARGEDIILSTGTASGKSLCYQIPILELLVNDPAATVLMIFPTKALTQDQRKNLVELIPASHPTIRPADIAIFDGDTPAYQRQAIKNHARVLLTNPDMLHQGLLPYHPSWSRFFQNLRIVVLDEAHVYRGIFGAHTANVIRRLKRVTDHYHGIRTISGGNSSLRFILCTATLSNARQLAEKLIGNAVHEINRDTSGNGRRAITFLNPPIVNEDLHVRAGSIHTAAKLVLAETKSGQQVLLFSQSRQSVETAVRRLRDFGIHAEGYRSGYLARERRTIENGLKAGSNRCVVATNALELGMDIGGMDTIISIGYPGSIASYYQRMGRAGRNQRDSRFFMVASQNPIDQYLMRHPEFITDRPIEPALIDPDNLLILFQHLQCALYETPFSTGESFGSISPEATQQILDYFVQSGIARKSGEKYYWLDNNHPQRSVSLRNSGLDRIAIVTLDLGGKRCPIGEIDRSSAYWMVHEGAIYFHNGICYQIKELNLEENFALAERTPAVYTTEADKQTAIIPGLTHEQRHQVNARLSVNEVSVKNRVVSYRRRDIETAQLLGIFPLDLPEETLETKAFIIQLSAEFRDQLRNQQTWRNDSNQYGSDWQDIRRKVVARDQFRCQLCGQAGTVKTLHVHHIVPFRNFSDRAEANKMENLTTLCPLCHQRVESAVLMRSGLAGYALAFHQISALFLECDPNDLSIHSEAESLEMESRPVIYLYETIPNGIGLSQAILERFDAIATAVYNLIQDCPCTDGCPGCVGPAGEIGIGGKQEALAIAAGMKLTTLSEDSPHE